MLSGSCSSGVGFRRPLLKMKAKELEGNPSKGGEREKSGSFIVTFGLLFGSAPRRSLLSKGWFFYLLQRKKEPENVFKVHSTPQRFIFFIFIKSVNIVLSIRPQECLGRIQLLAV